MVDTQILPACYAYHGRSPRASPRPRPPACPLRKATCSAASPSCSGDLTAKRTALESALGTRPRRSASEEDKAKHLSKDVSNVMFEVRTVCDELEPIVADDFWPLPKYREMLFLA